MFKTNVADFGLVQKILYLAYILSNKDLTKSEIIFEFAKKNINVSRTTIDNYIKTLTNNAINIKVHKQNGKNVYNFVQESSKITLDDEILSVFQELKKIIISQQNYYDIKNAAYLFYKISSFFDEKSINQIANFGYFSTLNWFLVNRLEKHCYDKDVILIDYVLPDNKSKEITIHADKLIIQGNSNRLYLSGTIGTSFQFFHLPVDRIFAVKEVIRKKACFDLSVRLLKYTVSKNSFDMYGLEENEAVYSEDGDKITIISPVFDEFSVIQRIMHYCPDVYYISDEKIKNIVVDKLKSLEKMYV